MIRKDRLIIRYAETVNLEIQHGGYTYILQKVLLQFQDWKD